MLRTCRRRMCRVFGISGISLVRRDGFSDSERTNWVTASWGTMIAMRTIAAIPLNVARWLGIRLMLVVVFVYCHGMGGERFEKVHHIFGFPTGNSSGLVAAITVFLGSSWATRCRPVGKRR